MESQFDKKLIIMTVSSNTWLIHMSSHPMVVVRITICTFSLGN